MESLDNAAQWIVLAMDAFFAQWRPCNRLMKFDMQTTSKSTCPYSQPYYSKYHCTTFTMFVVRECRKFNGDLFYDIDETWLMREMKTALLAAFFENGCESTPSFWGKRFYEAYRTIVDSNCGDCQPHKLVLAIHGISIEEESEMNPKCESDTNPCQYNGRFGIEFTFGDQKTSECPHRKGWAAEGRPICHNVDDCWGGGEGGRDAPACNGSYPTHHCMCNKPTPSPRPYHEST